MPPTDGRVGALARETERVGRRLDAVDTRLGEVGRVVGELDGHLRGLAEDVAALLTQHEATRPRSWLQVTELADARAVLIDLVEWLDAVYLRYPDASLPACWMWHPTVVEELLWLRHAHAAAYIGSGWAARAGEWHDRHRPGVVSRLAKAVSACGLQRHMPGGQRDTKPQAAPLAGHLDGIAAAWTTTGLPPAPSQEQLRDAQAYTAEQFRSPST
jgi:hypothetical protein